MQTHDYSITGQILDHSTEQGIPGLHVEIWDKDRYYDDFIGRAETDAEGSFEIDFNDSYFKERNEQRPDLYFRLIKDNKTINSETFDITVTPLYVNIPVAWKLIKLGDRNGGI